MALCPLLGPLALLALEGDLGAKLDEYVSRCAAFGFSGSVLVARDGNVLLQKGYGYADAAAKIANTPDTLHDLASTSKQITAAAVLRLEMDGKISLDDPIAKHLPAVPESHRKITIRHLLNHTSGIPRVGPTGFGPDLAVAVAGYLESKPKGSPGSRFEYYNGGYALLAAIVELRAGTPFTEYCRAELFGPAGLKATGFLTDEGVDPASVAHGHRLHRDTGLATAHSFGWEYRGMGGVLSSVVDMYRWDRALRGTEVLSEEAGRKLLTPALDDYACGWRVVKTKRNTRLVRHGGDVDGFASEFLRFVDEDAAVILLSNVEGISWQVADNLASLLFGERLTRPAPPENVPVSEADVRALEGTYASPSKARLVVRLDGNRLVVEAEGQEAVDLLQAGLDDADPRRYAKLEAIASKILDGLAKGDVAAIRAHLAPGIPEAWPDRVLSKNWPERLSKRGKLTSRELLGAREEGARVLLTVRLVQERGDSNVEIGFTDGKLSFLELARDAGSAARAYYAPASKTELVHWRFGENPLPALSFQRVSGGPAQRVTAGSGGRKLVFTRSRHS